MIKNNKKDNILIKKKLINEMRKFGINRVNSDSVIFLDEYVLAHLRKLFKALKEELIINGKKTLEKKDVINVLENIEKKDGFEI